MIIVVETNNSNNINKNIDKKSNKNEILYTIDGITFIVRREFNVMGSSILENLITILLNKIEMEKT